MEKNKKWSCWKSDIPMSKWILFGQGPSCPPNSRTSWLQRCSVRPRQWPPFCMGCPSSGRTPSNSVWAATVPTDSHRFHRLSHGNHGLMLIPWPQPELTCFFYANGASLMVCLFSDFENHSWKQSLKNFGLLPWLMNWLERLRSTKFLHLSLLLLWVTENKLLNLLELMYSEDATNIATWGLGSKSNLHPPSSVTNHGKNDLERMLIILCIILYSILKQGRQKACSKVAKGQRVWCLSGLGHCYLPPVGSTKTGPRSAGGSESGDELGLGWQETRLPLHVALCEVSDSRTIPVSSIAEHQHSSFNLVRPCQCSVPDGKLRLAAPVWFLGHQKLIWITMDSPWIHHGSTKITQIQVT